MVASPPSPLQNSERGSLGCARARAGQSTHRQGPMAMPRPSPPSRQLDEQDGREVSRDRSDR
eukprot:3677619-Alexandrium_andersonii.AAC.1